MKQPMKKGSFVPKNVPGVGWGGSCRGRVGWGGSCRGGGVCHAGVGHAGGWGVSCRGGVGHVGVGWGGVGHAGVGWGGVGWVM